MKKSSILFLLPLVTVLSFSVSMQGAAPKPKAPLNTFQPTITRVDKDGITVLTGRNPGVKVTVGGVVQPPSNVKMYRVIPSTQITVDGLPATFGQLKAGMAADVVAGLDPKIAASVVANTIGKPLAAKPPVKKKKNNTAPSEPIIGMRVQSVTPDRITIAHPGSKASAYLITKDTTIQVNGTPGKLSDIRAGMSVTVSSDGQKATSISAQNPPPLK